MNESMTDWSAPKKWGCDMITGTPKIVKNQTGHYFSSEVIYAFIENNYTSGVSVVVWYLRRG